MTGCCELRPFPKPEIKDTDSARNLEVQSARFLAPRTVNTVGVPTSTCIDAHAHFFNASDVTVKGFVAGPVAYSRPGLQGYLLKLLAPVADALGEIAPTAKMEYDRLHGIASVRAAPASIRASLEAQKQSERQAISVEFNRLIQSRRGKPFREAYENAMRPTARSRELRPRIRALDDDSVFNAMSQSEAPLSLETVRAFAASDQSGYGEGVLAFVGYMLSSRSANLLTYQSAFTEQTNSIGVRRTLGLLVDFDHWLECAPRSAHEDQMKLHLRLSQLSNGYMLPVMSYNPWSDAVSHGGSLELVEEAIRAGFVGVKIYPPNGFRPWGNQGMKEPWNAPTGAEIDAALQAFWLKCQELQVPVIAHEDESMGSDQAHDVMGSPDAWGALLNAPFWSGEEGPQVSLGHFGGDSDAEGNDWTGEFAELMAKPRAERIYADLAYWADLQCSTVGQQACVEAEERLQAVLTKPVGNGQIVADRVMYGSDWLMLSQEKNWPSYAQQLNAAIQAIAAPYAPKIFGLNAQRCFGSRLQLT